MSLSRNLVSLALGTAAAALVASMPASAAQLSMYVRASGADAAQGMVDLWNSSHADKIDITVIPDNQMVTKLATGVQSGDVPDIISFDLIYMPDFMRAGFLEDLTDQLKSDPNQAKVAKAYQDLATYKGKLYGTGFTPDVSILLYNKDLFTKAGLDPNKPPTTVDEIVADAKKIRALGGNTYGYYFSGSCPGCNIFTMAPMMWASGAHLLPKEAGDPILQGPGIKEVLTAFRQMWTDGVIPPDAQSDTGNNFTAVFETGNVGMQGAGGFAISTLKKNHPEINFGIAPLPGIKEGEKSSFVGGDVIAVPKGSKHPDIALQFIKWELTDQAQLEGLAKNNILPSRTDLADNKYFQADPRYITTAKAVGIGQVPWVFHFNDMVNSDASPWISMIQTAIFDGKIDQAISTASEKMKEISNE